MTQASSGTPLREGGGILKLRNLEINSEEIHIHITKRGAYADMGTGAGYDRSMAEE